jgi:ParB-like chromosome segregation protein Spo0J
MQGFTRAGSDVPYFDPLAIVIVGIDTPLTADNWYAGCPRVNEELDAEFLDNVRQNGVVQVVHGYKDGDQIVLLAGRRRVRAARIVRKEQLKAGERDPKKLISVRVELHKAPPAKLYAINVGENVQRKDFNPLQRAELMRQGLKYGADENTVAEAFGVTSATVRNALVIFDCAADVQKAYAAGLALASVKELAKEPREKQRTMLATMTSVGAVKGAKAQNAIRQLRAGKRVTAPDSTRMRSGAFMAKFRDAIQADAQGEGDVPSEVFALIDFTLGKPDALRKFPTLQAAAEAAGLRPGKAGKGKP